MNSFEKYYQYKFEMKDMDLSLSRINSALEDIYFNENDLGQIIHIAGTNGKGSTSFFLAQMFYNYGYNTALFTSPHIISINERISFNLENISDFDFNNIFQNNIHIIEKYNLSYFEAVFFISIIHFMKKKPNVTILETGLGGRFDATNTNLINNKICILTAIGQDHVDYLGKNIYGIIDEKIAILRERNPFFIAPNRNFVYEHIFSKNLSNNIYKIKYKKENKSIYPFPYEENYNTAKQVFKYITNKEFTSNKPLLLPMCRMEKINNIYLDGAHNPAGILSIIPSWKNKNIDTIIFTVTKDRDILKTLTLLKQVTDNVILTTIPNHYRSIDSFSNSDCLFIQNPEDALNYAYKTTCANILITGSFYLCGFIKNILAMDNNNG